VCGSGGRTWLGAVGHRMMRDVNETGGEGSGKLRQAGLGSDPEFIREHSIYKNTHDLGKNLQRIIGFGR